MRILLLVFFLLAFGPVFGVESGHGLVVTKTDSLYGEIKLDLDNNRINLRDADNRYHSMLASQVDKVIIGRGMQQKRYASAVFGADSDVYLFRVLSEGKVSLYYREGVKFSRFDSNAFPPYCALVGKSLYSLGSKKEFFAVFGSEEKAMKEFMKEQDLDYDNTEDLISLFNHFNGVEASQIFAFKD